LLDSLLQEAVSSETNEHVKFVKKSKVSEEFHRATNKAKNSSNATSIKACKTVNDKVSKRNKKQPSDTSKISDNKKADSVNFVAECYYKTVTFSAEDFSARLKRLRGEEENEESVDFEDIEDPGDTEASDISSNHSSYSCGNSEFESPSLMLSAEERQELAENAMEQLATGLNKAAETMQTVETSEPDDPASVEAGQAVPDVASLQDRELFQLLEEAYSYKRPRDRQGKSEIFRELLEKAEENSSGEEQWDINFRKYMTHQDSSGKKKKKRVSESNKKGGSLSNLSCLSDNDSSSCKGNNKNKKSRSSVSSRSREGGSLPPTKFENVMLYETGSNSSNFTCPCLGAWDTGPNSILGSPATQGMPEETFIETSELQPLLHSTSDTALRRRVVQSLDTRETVAIDMDGLGECDTDSNKTEVEEIEMVEMESRDVSCEADSDEMTAARHRLETRQDFYNGDDREASSGSVDVDENGNPSSRHIHPIMHNNVRPVSIYRHTPVFRPQKLTVPHTVHNNGSQGYGSTSSMMTNGSVGDQGTDSRKTSNGDTKRKNRRKKDEEKNTVKAEDIEGYRGNKDIDSLLEFLGEGEDSKKKSKKTSEKIIEKSKKVMTKSESTKDEKVRKKKEKSQEKDVTKPAVTKKLSTDTFDNNVIEEEDKRCQSPKNEDSVRQSMSPDKDGGETDRGSPCIPEIAKTPSASAPSSNDSGHVSGGPFSLPSISSTKEMSIASSPPLDLDSIEFTEESVKDVADVASHHSEFTKVTKKQRKKKKRGVYPPGSHEAGVRATSQDPESEHGGGWSFRHSYRSRETVSGTKSTCSVPPSEASDTDDHDSVHSLPVGSTRTKVAVCVASVSSGHTPHASYADIARHAAALQTQQQGQKQHDVYREQLQYRENTPGVNTKESVSSNEDYFYNPDLDASFPPVQPPPPFSILPEAESAQNQSDSNNSSHSKHRNSNSSNNNHNITNNNPPPTTQSTDTQQPTLRSQSASSENKLKSKLRQNKSDPSIVLPPVVILQKEQFEANTSDTGFTFGFEVNESLLAMSFVGNEKDILDNKVISDNLKNGDNVIGNNEECCDNEGLVVNQSYEDNEMMKKLLLYNKADEQENPEVVADNDDIDDDDVVVESSSEPQDFEKLKNILCDVENLNYKNFNYDVIVHFVSKAWDVVNKEMKSGRQVCYYSS